jgi:hypothetical protein
MDELTINGIIYVRKDSVVNCNPRKVDGSALGYGSGSGYG